MATITAAFKSDFTDFNEGLKQAESNLVQFSQNSGKSWDTVITGMSEAGQAVKDMGQAAKETAPEVEGLTTQYSDFDSLLRASGVNIGTQTKALAELGKMAGLSASSLALMGPAAAVVGTAMAAMKVGNWIREITGSDEAIANMTASLMGWGDMAEEVAGANADAIALAFMRTGKFAGDATEALRLNTAWMKENAAKAKEAAKEQEELAKSMKEAAEKSLQWTRDNQERFLTWERERAEKSKAIRDKANKEVEDAAKAHADRIKAITDEVFGAEQVQQVKDWQEAITKMGGQIDILSTAQLANLSTALHTALDAMGRTGQLTSEAAAQFTALIVQVDQVRAKHSAAAVATTEFKDALYDAAVAQDAEYAAILKANGELAKVPALKKAASADFLTGPGVPSTGLSVVGGALERSDFGGNVGMPMGGVGMPVFNNAVAARNPLQGTLVTNNFHIIDTESGIARRVSESITNSLKSSSSFR